MLALTRKAGEKLVIDDQIVLTIIEVKGETVRVAIDAPKRIKIYRGEIYDAIAKENRMAAVSKPEELKVLDEIKIKNEISIKEK